MPTRIKRTFLIEQNLFFKFKSYVAQQHMPSYSDVLEELVRQYLKNPTATNEILKSPKNKKTTEVVVEEGREDIV